MTFRAVWRDSDKTVERDDTGRQRVKWSRPTVTGGMVTPEQFGAAGDGVTDDAPAIQAAIDYAARIRGGVQFLAEAYAVYPAQIIAEDYKSTARFALIGRSHTTLALGRSRLVLIPRLDIANVGILELHRVEDVRVIGGTLVGDRGAWEQPAPAGDGSRCIAIWSCRDVTIDGTRLIDSRGDGLGIYEVSRWFKDNIGATEGSPVITIGAGGRNAYLLPQVEPGHVAVSDHFPRGTTVTAVDVPGKTITLSHPANATGAAVVNFHLAESQHILVTGCIGDNSRRNGLTIESGRGIMIRDCEWTNSNGASPEAGIDVEPYFGYDFLQDVTITGNRTSGNVMAGMYVQNVRHVRVRDCQIEDGIGLRGAAEAVVAGNIIRGGLTIRRSGAQVNGNRLADCGVAIYSESGTRHRLPLDVEIVGNAIISQVPDGARVAVQNVDGEPPAIRHIVIRTNTLRTQTADTTQRALVTTTGSPSAETMEIADNTITLECGHSNRTSGRGILADLAGGHPVTIAGNRLNLSATSTLAGAALVALYGDGEYRVHGNIAESSTPNTVPLITRPGLAAVHATHNLASGVSTLAAEGALATDQSNVLL